MKKVSFLMMLAALALWAGASAVGATLYTNTFDNVTDVSSSGPGFASAPAPGGKSGNALHISGGSGGAVNVTPTGPGFPLAGPATIIFRFYVYARDSQFTGAYDYYPGEGIAFMADESVHDSYGQSLTTYHAGTWYTCAIYHPAGSYYLSFYLKEGANAVLSEADSIGGSAYPPAALNLQYTEFWNFQGNGDWYVDDYTVNSGKDFSIVHPVTVQGTVAPEDYYTTNLQDVGVRIQFRKGATTVTARTFLNDNGTFVLPNVVDTGTYDVAVKACGYLQQVLPNVNIASDITLDPITLLNGDVDGDNEVTSADLSVVLKNMDAIGNP